MRRKGCDWDGDVSGDVDGEGEVELEGDVKVADGEGLGL